MNTWFFIVLELFLGGFFLLFYFGKVSTGKGKQHNDMTRKFLGKGPLVVGILALVSAAVDITRKVLGY